MGRLSLQQLLFSSDLSTASLARVPSETCLLTSETRFLCACAASRPFLLGVSLCVAVNGRGIRKWSLAVLYVTLAVLCIIPFPLSLCVC